MCNTAAGLKNCLNAALLNNQLLAHMFLFNISRCRRLIIKHLDIQPTCLSCCHNLYVLNEA